jgi:hypothetical protein
VRRFAVGYFGLAARLRLCVGGHPATASYELAAQYEKGQNRSSLGVALRYLDAGDKDRATAWLQQDYDNRGQSLPCLGMPTRDPIRSDRRFQALLRRVGLPH